MVQVTSPRWPPCPYMVKTFKSLLQNQKSYDLETWHVTLGTQALQSLCKWWRWVDLDLFYARGLSAPAPGLYTYLNLQQVGKVIRAFCWHQKFVPKGLSALASGLNTYIKIIENVYKIRFLFLNLPRMGKVIRAFCWHQHLSPRSCLPLPWGYIHV